MDWRTHLMNVTSAAIWLGICLASAVYAAWEHEWFASGCFTLATLLQLLRLRAEAAILRVILPRPTATSAPSAE